MLSETLYGQQYHYTQQLKTLPNHSIAKSVHKTNNITLNVHYYIISYNLTYMCLQAKGNVHLPLGVVYPP